VVGAPRPCAFSPLPAPYDEDDDDDIVSSILNA
jgi:hypothetical protein